MVTLAGWPNWSVEVTVGVKAVPAVCGLPIVTASFFVAPTVIASRANGVVPFVTPVIVAVDAASMTMFPVVSDCEPSIGRAFRLAIEIVSRLATPLTVMVNVNVDAVIVGDANVIVSVPAECVTLGVVDVSNCQFAGASRITVLLVWAGKSPFAPNPSRIVNVVIAVYAGLVAFAALSSLMLISGLLSVTFAVATVA